MSIEISKDLCTGCGRCSEICPGSLLCPDRSGKAEIRKPERCWGCASCLKECPAGAIALYLSEDIGGLGGRMTVKKENALLYWTVSMPGGAERNVTVDSRNSNQY